MLYNALIQGLKTHGHDSFLGSLCELGLNLMYGDGKHADHLYTDVKRRVRVKVR